MQNVPFIWGMKDKVNRDCILKKRWLRGSTTEVNQIINDIEKMGLMTV